MVTLENFILFKSNHGNGTHHGLTGETSIVRTDREKFADSLKEFMVCTDNLHTSWRDNPYYRCSDGKRRNHKFFCASTIWLVRTLGTGNVERTNNLSVIMEEESRKIRIISMKHEKRDNNSRIICIFTCDLEWQVDGVVESSCWHVELLKRDEVLMRKAWAILETGFYYGHYVFFGHMLNVKDGSGRSGAVVAVEGEDGVAEILESENGMVPIQLDEAKVEDLTKRSHRIAKRWSIYNVNDITDDLLVTFVWRPVNNGVNRTRTMCGICRTDLTRNCKHENACERESRYGASGDGSSHSEYEDDSNEDSAEIDGNGEDVALLET